MERASLSFEETNNLSLPKEENKHEVAAVQQNKNITCLVVDEDEYDTDIETDEGPHKRITFRDMSSEELYQKSCQVLQVVVSTYFLKNLKKDKIIMKHHGLGPVGCKAIAAPLVTNTCVCELDIEDNWITHEGFSDICDMLMENCFITSLNVAQNKLGSKGAHMFKDMILENSNLKHINISRNEFSCEDGKFFADGLSVNLRLKSLNLSGNEFSEKGGEYLGKGLAINESIEELDLSWNHLRGKGAIAIAAGMKANMMIKQLDLSWNGFSDDGAKAMGEMLKTNNTLQHLDLSNNRIGLDGAVGIATGLVNNDTLRVIRLHSNPLGAKGASIILQAISTNTNSAIIELGLKDVPVDQAFHEMVGEVAKRFENETGESFQYEVQRMDDYILEATPHADEDPVELLANFLEKKRVRLLDLFKSFDKDQSWTITPEEFAIGIRNAGMDFSQRQMVALMQALDHNDDGEIDYKEFLDGRQKWIERRRIRRKNAARKEAYDKKQKEFFNVRWSDAMDSVSPNRSLSVSPHPY